MIRFCKTELTKDDAVLVPYRSLWVRLLIFAALMSINFIGTTTWYKVLFTAAFFGLILGTFPRPL